jgi:cytochrome P450
LDLPKRAITRRATKDTTVKGIPIPEGISVVVDVMSLHFDPEIWGPVDPHEFYPLRFSPDIKRNPLAFMTFGNGPRNCIGKLVDFNLRGIQIFFFNRINFMKA